MLAFWLAALPANAQDDRTDPVEAPAVDAGHTCWLGIVVRPVSDELAAQLSDVLPEGTGLVVTRVLKDSPADDAGLKEHDLVATCDGLPVTGEQQLREQIAALPPGEPVGLQVVRRARLRTIEVTPRRRPMAPAALPRHVLERAAAAAVRAPRTRSLSLTTADGRTYDLESVSVDDDGRQERTALSGERAELLERLDDLPASARATARQSLADFEDDRRKTHGVRCRLHPRVERGTASVRVQIARTCADGRRRLFELEHAVDPEREIRGEDLLELDLLSMELEELPQSLRGELEDALRRVRIPQVRVEVQNSL